MAGYTRRNFLEMGLRKDAFSISSLMKNNFSDLSSHQKKLFSS